MSLPYCFCMRYHALYLAAILAVFLGGCAPKPAPAHGIMNLTISSPEGIVLHATLFQPANENPPGILLVSPPGRDRHVWDAAAERLRTEHTMSLTFELPHEIENDGDRVRGALTSAKKVLLDHGADSGNLAIAGEDFGANLAVQYALHDPAMQAIALISPNAVQQAAEVTSAIAKLKERPIFLMAAEGDTVSAALAASLKASAKGFCELRMYPGTANGADLFVSSVDALEQFLQWISLVVGRQGSEGERGDGQHDQPAQQLGQ